MESRRSAIQRDLEWFGNVAREQIGVGQRFPVRAAMLEREVRSFQSHALPAERHEVRHRLAAGTTKVYHAQRAIAALAAQLRVHIKDELLVRAVIDGRALGREVVRGLEGNGILCLALEYAHGFGAAGAPEGHDEVP